MRPSLLKTIVSRLNRARARRSLGPLRHLIERSDLFDSEWYLERYPDIARAGLDPLEHFIRNGAAEGRSPGPQFDAKWYLRQNPDVARSGGNPLAHYLEHGRGEGRSIKPLDAAAGEDADAASPALPEPSSAPIEPFLNDFDTIWQARHHDWPALAAASEEHARSDAPDLAVLHDQANDGPAHWRIALFMALRERTAPAFGAFEADLPTIGLGIELFADGWFAHARRLLLRMGRDVPEASRVVAFQHGNAGTPQRIAAQPAVGAPGLVQLDLDNALAPVLLVWLGADDEIIDTALPLFPSLYRGGLHHAEALAVTALHPGPAAVTKYMVELAGDWLGSAPLLLGRITVALGGANGTEPIFQHGIAEGLRRHFGVAVFAESAAEQAQAGLAERLGGSTPEHGLDLRRESMSELALAPDMLPSLASLCASATSRRVGEAALAIVRRDRPAEAVLVCLPRLAGATRQMAHPALPPPMPEWRPGPGSPPPLDEAGLPSAIRALDRRVWQVDALVPLSPDVALPQLPAGGGAPLGVQVILLHSSTPEDLALSVAGIAAQTGVALCGIAVLSDQTDLALPDAGDVPIRVVARAGLAALPPASFVIMSDTSVFAHDPRIFAVLCGLVSSEGIGSASCAVVSSPALDGTEEQAGVAWVADCTAVPAVPADQSIVSLCPGASFDVAASDVRMLAIRSEIWDNLRTDADLLDRGGALALALAQECRQQGLRSVATTLVRVATSRSDALPPEYAARLADLFVEPRVQATSAHLIRLMP